MILMTGGDPIPREAWDECFDDDLTCEYCGGSGADAWERFMPCEECDGEGYRWWE
jgi:DnaJ-class molecular chaperone